MTVSSTTNRKSFTGDAVTTSFGTSPMVFFDTSDLKVYVVTTATGAATLLTENTHYTVSGGAGSTGTVSLAGGSAPYGAPSASQTLLIVRELPLTQETDLANNDASDAEVVEDALDRLTIIAQQLEDANNRALTLPTSDVSGASTELPVPLANTLIGWDSAGTALENKTPADVDLTLVSSFIATLLDDANAAAARATLGAAASSDLASYAPLASPALTGNPTAPTPSPGDNDTSIATTAFVTAALAALSTGSYTVGTAQATTSGTAKDFTGIPSTADIVIGFWNGVSTNGASNLIFQIGDSGGIENSGYVGGASTDGGTRVARTDSFPITAVNAAGQVNSGAIILFRTDASNTWTAIWQVWDTGTVYEPGGGAGYKQLSATLDRVRFTSVTPDTFDLGSVNIAWISLP